MKEKINWLQSSGKEEETFQADKMEEIIKKYKYIKSKKHESMNVWKESIPQLNFQQGR